MNLLSLLRSPRADGSGGLDFNEWISWFRFNGLDYPVVNQTLAGVPQQEIPPMFYGFSEMAYKANPVLFACVVARMLLFSQARFRFRPKLSVAPGDLALGPELGILEKPWPRASTSVLLRQISMYADLAGNAYAYRDSATTLRLARPDWVTAVLGSARDGGQVGDIDTEIIGYIYKPMGVGTSTPLLPEHMAHFAPYPDPIFPWRGMSWIQPLLEEIHSDNAATTHKRMFFANGATANMVVNLGTQVNETDFDQWVELFEEGHRGTLNAFKTIYLAAGADAKVVGANMDQMDFKNVQAHGENRMTVAARVPAIIVGVSEGLDASTYSNFGQARRAFADLTARPWWQGLCECLETVVDVPDGNDLWYDERIPFLLADQTDAAAVQQLQAATIASLIQAGFSADSVVKAVQSGDLSHLAHTGLTSVQLQPPGTSFAPTQNPTTPPGRSNGSAAPAGR